MSGAGSATSAALSIATAAICLGMGYVAQLFVKAEPFGGDPRAVTGTHTLYTVDELKGMQNDKDRVDAYYNKRADLHDVLEATVQTRDVKAAYPKLEGKQELLLLKKAIEQFYPAAAAPALAHTGAVAVPLPPPAPAPAPAQTGAVAVPLPPPAPAPAPPPVTDQEIAKPESSGPPIRPSIQPPAPPAAPAPAPAPSAPPAEQSAKQTPADPYEATYEEGIEENPQGGSRKKTIQMGGGSNSGQTIQVAVGSTDAPHPQSEGGVQPQGYLPGLGHIGVGQ